MNREKSIPRGKGCASQHRLKRRRATDDFQNREWFFVFGDECDIA